MLSFQEESIIVLFKINDSSSRHLIVFPVEYINPFVGAFDWFGFIFRINILHFFDAFSFFKVLAVKYAAQSKSYFSSFKRFPKFFNKLLLLFFREGINNDKECQ